MIDLIAKLWPYLLGLGGVVAAVFYRQQGKTTQAQARQEVAEVKQQAAETKAAAAQSGADAVQERTNVENEIAALPADSVEQRLRDEWTRQ